MRPTREHATNTGQTYMVTSSTWERRSLFRNERWARLLIDTLFHYRESAYLLHEFVIMPDHFHVLLTPKTSLEKAVQFIKGGFSYRAKKELGSNMEVWQKGFSDHRIRDAGDYLRHVDYIRQNPARKSLCDRAEEYPYSSAHPGFELDAAPQGLKPDTLAASYGASEAAPFQNVDSNGASEAAPFQNVDSNGTAEAAPFQNVKSYGAPEGAPYQNKKSGDASEVTPLHSRPPKAAGRSPLQDKPGKIA